MAEEGENGQEKTEQPTAKKLADAKKKGQVGILYARPDYRHDGTGIYAITQ